jgi:hypothetical protein
MNPTDPDLYLVRIWRGACAFRATARRVDDEVLLCAHSVQELAEVLAGNARRPDEAPGPDAQAPPAKVRPPG